MLQKYINLFLFIDKNNPREHGPHAARSSTGQDIVLLQKKTGPGSRTRKWNLVSGCIALFINALLLFLIRGGSVEWFLTNWINYNHNLWDLQLFLTLLSYMSLGCNNLQCEFNSSLLNHVIESSSSTLSWWWNAGYIHRISRFTTRWLHNIITC